MPEVSPLELLDYVERIFVAAGAPDHDAAVVAAHLVDANLKGHDSHGVIWVATYLERIQTGEIKPGAPLTVINETDGTAFLDGGLNFGQVVSRRATQMAIEKARAIGTGVVVCYNNAHTGRLGAYAEQAAEAGMLALAVANVNGPQRVVAPHGGAGRRLGTNPIAFGAPTADQDAPFVLDMATSGAAGGSMRMARNLGQQVPAGVLLDARGSPTQDPNAFYAGGAILPLAGQKGFGLAMAVEALAGALTPADPTGPLSQGFFILVLDPERFVGRTSFEASMSALIEWVTQPPYQPGFEEILVPGEGSRRRAEQRALAIPLDDETWLQLGEVATSQGVEPPSLEPPEPRRRRSRDSEEPSPDD